MLVGTPSWPACRKCGGELGLDADGDLVCQCGTGDTSGAAAWEHVQLMLLARAGGACEARTPWCLADRRTGSLANLPRDRVSIHHRQPRGMGGTSRATVHALTNLLLLDGSGVTGCHGYIESERTEAYRRGLLVRRPTPPADVPVTLWSGREVRLDASGLYVPTGHWDLKPLAA